MSGQCGWCGTSGVMTCIYLDGRPSCQVPCYHCKGSGSDLYETTEERALTAAEDAGIQKPVMSQLR